VTRPAPRVHRRDDGFTLVEILVAMTISLLVLFAVLTTLDIFDSTAGQQSRDTDANERIRSTVDATVRDLRSAASVTRAQPNDLVYAVPASSTASTYRRLCLDPSGRLSAGESKTVADPGPSCPSTVSGWTGGRIAEMKALNGASRPMFDYDGAASSSAPGKVRAVGISISLDSGAAGRKGSSTLRASAVVRRTAGLLAVDASDIDVACTPTGPQLSLGVDVPLALGPVSVTYASDGGLALGTGLGTIPVPAGVTTVLATITDALGVTTTIRKPVTCS
jgi:prepilin-type N-terminal cleavage/methylation domain-containing protein